MSQQPESGPPVLKLYAIELPDGSIAMNGPYVLATENEGQAGRMAHARDGQEIAFVREIQQAQGVGESGLDDLCQRLSEHGAKSGRRAATKRYNDGVPTYTEMLMGQAVDAIRRLATPQSSAPVVGDELASLYDAASVGFHISESCGPERKFLRITSFPSLDALQAYEDAWTEAMVSVRDARRESALTGRG